MSKLPSIQINIPSPCSQSWDDMIPSGHGRFCGHCQKNVIDFTTWTDAALYQYFSKDIGHTCGRFLTSQLDRPIHIPHQPHSRLYRMTIALSLTLICAQTPHLLAQNRPPQTAQTIDTNYRKEQDPIPLTGGQIRGQVLDNKKEPLISAAIQVYQNGILKGGAVTDFDGNYLIKPLDTGLYNVIVVYLGFDSVTDDHVVVTSDRSTIRNYNMMPNISIREVNVTMGWKKPLIDPDRARQEDQAKKPARKKK